MTIFAVGQSAIVYVFLHNDSRLPLFIEFYAREIQNLISNDIFSPRQKHSTENVK